MNTLPNDKNKSEVKFVRKYIIPGNPISLARPRLGPHSFYSIDTDKRFYFENHISNQHNDDPLLEGPLKLDITFFFKTSATRRSKDFGFKPYSHMIYKPDLSNLIKFIEEVATDILFKDDCTIASISAQKLYDTTPRTEFTLVEIGSENTSRKSFQKKEKN